MKQLWVRFLCWWNDVCYIHKEIKVFPQWVGTAPYCRSCTNEYLDLKQSQAVIAVKRRQEEQEKIVRMIP